MKSKRFRKLLPVIQPYSLFNLRETSSSKTETGKQILLYNNFIWPWKHREMILEQLIQRVKAEEKKRLHSGMNVTAFLMGKIKIKCKMISICKEKCCEKYIM